MKEGSVVIAVMPQSDGGFKRRPAIALRELPGFQNLLICGVSSQLHQKIAGFDEIFSRRDSDFGSSGLHSDSLIRLGHLLAVPKKLIEGEIGLIAQNRHKRLLKTLSAYLGKK